MERLKTHVLEDEGHWLWLGALDGETPIVRLSQPRRIRPARRHAYELYNELVVPPTHVVKNVCGKSNCICPWHGRAVKRGSQMNERFGFNPPSYCKRGHEWTDWNTMPQHRAGSIMCRACHNGRTREAARLRKPQNAAAQRRSVARKAEIVASFKTACIRCRESDQACLDFHHRDGTTKDFTVSEAMRRLSRVQMIVEIEKCDVMCANCHRKFHRDERLKKAAEHTLNSVALEIEG